jgi:HlyD family secretion protein
MHKGLQRVLTVLMLLIVGGIIWYVETVRQSEHSVLSGFFEDQPTQISTRVAGKVSEILVAEGDSVKAGQTLITLDSTPDISQQQAKAAASEQALEQLRELKNGPRQEDIQKQQAAVAEAEANLANLADGPRPSEIAEAQAAERSAAARYAAAKRGPTVEEIAEAKGKYDSALAAESLAKKDAARYTSLFALDAITKQQNDESQATLAEATANRQDLYQAWQRSVKGTPSDELEDSHQSYLQAKAALDLVLAGSRTEDIAATRAKLAEARASLSELIAGTRPEDIIQARLAYKAAEAEENSAAIDIADRTVKAPYNGFIDNIPVSIGDLVSPGQALVRLDNPSDIWIRVYIPEYELSKAVVGADVKLKIDSLAAPVDGNVESVASHGEFTPANLQSPDERGKQVYAVRIRMKHSSPAVKAGMDATVTRIGSWTP